MRRSREQQRIEVLKAINDVGAALPTRLCQITGIMHDSIKKHLAVLIQAGQIEKVPAPRDPHARAGLVPPKKPPRTRYFLKTTTRGQKTIILHEQFIKALNGGQYEQVS